MTSKAGKVFTWLGVGAVLFFCLITSCILSSASLSKEGRDFFGDLYRNAGNVGKEYDEPVKAVNADYALSFREDGGVGFAGDGFQLVLPAGYRITNPAAPVKAERSFDYYFRSGHGDVEVRLRRGSPLSSYYSFNPDERKDLLLHARVYAVNAAGEAAVDAAPLAYAPPAWLAYNLADAGVEGCYAYTPEVRKETGFDGEYFVFIGRGYGNLVVASVAFKPFAREAALLEGRKLLETLRFN